MLKIGGIFLSIATIGLSSPASIAQSLAWRSQVTMDARSGVGLSTPNAILDGQATMDFAVTTHESPYTENYRYRVFATDSSSGDPVWSAELGRECQTRSSAYSLLVPIAGGDIVVVAQAIGSVAIGYGFTCVRRLRVADGSVVWSRLLGDSDSVLYIDALTPDGDGHLLGGGRIGDNAYALRLDAGTGQTLWEQEIAPSSGHWRANIIVAVAGPTNDAVLQLVEQVSSVPDQQRLLGIDPRSGNLRWTHTRCMEGAAVSQRASNDIRLRMLADSTFGFVLACRDGGGSVVEIGRMNASTGAVLWQRALSQSNLYRSLIDRDGYFVLDGSLLIDGNEVGVSRLDPVSGQLQWSLPRPPGTSGPSPYVTNRLLVTDTHVHVLELLVEYSQYVKSAAIATYAAATGEFLGRFDAGFPNSESALWPTLSMRARGVGDVLVTALSTGNLNAGGRLFGARINVAAQHLAWSRMLPLMSARPFIPISADLCTHQMTWGSAQEPGVVLGGDSISQAGFTYPRVAKVSALDGRVLWRWQSDSRRDGFVQSVFADRNADIVVAGSNGRDQPTLLLAKLDGADGSSIWESATPEPRPALDAISGPLGTILVMLGSVEGEPDSPIRVASYSGSDGSSVWNASIPDSIEAYDRVSRLATGQGGTIFALTSFHESATGQRGMQVAQLRGTDGALLWRRQLPNSGNSDAIALLSVGNGDVVAADRDVAWRVDGASGAVLWEKTLPYWTWSMILDAHGQLLIGGRKNGQRAVSAINALDGVIRWTRSLPISNEGGYSELVSKLILSDDGNIFAAGGNGRGDDVLAKMSPLDGGLEWQAVTGVGVPNSGVVDYPVSLIEAPDHNVFVSGLADGLDSDPTWTVTKMTGSFADGIFSTGFE